MARIRTIKPEFFRDETLQDLQIDNPDLNPMLVFAGLWTLCDKAGRFEWKPRTIKLDILPFLDFDLGASLVLLMEAGLIKQYEHHGKLYGLVVNFELHQRISGKEAQEKAKHPEPESFNNNINNITKGSVGEAPDKHPVAQERKGKEREREKEGKGMEGSTEISPGKISDTHVQKKQSTKKTGLPENFQPSQKILEWYSGKEYRESIDIHLESFVTKCLAKNYMYADWDAAFRSAITDDWARARGVQPRASPGQAVKFSPVTVQNIETAKSWLEKKRGLVHDG